MKVQQNYAGVFEGMDFGEYQYQHYPLMMSNKQGGTRIVEDENEEATAVADGYIAPKVGPPANVTIAEVENLKNANAETKKDLEDAEAELVEVKRQLADAKKALEGMIPTSVAGAPMVPGTPPVTLAGAKHPPPPPAGLVGGGDRNSLT